MLCPYVCEKIKSRRSDGDNTCFREFNGKKKKIADIRRTACNVHAYNSRVNQHWPVYRHHKNSSARRIRCLKKKKKRKQQINKSGSFTFFFSSFRFFFLFARAVLLSLLAASVPLLARYHSFSRPPARLPRSFV